MEELNAIGMSAKVQSNLFEISRGKSTSKNKTIVCYFYVGVLTKNKHVQHCLAIYIFRILNKDEN